MEPTLIYSFILLITVVAASIVILVAVNRKTAPGAIPLAYLMGAVAIWSLSGALEMSSHGESQKIFWSQVSYIGVMTSSPFLFWFAMQYHHRKINLWVKIFATFFPLAGIILAFTNDWHYLLWSGYHYLQGTNILVYEKGPIFWVVIICVYSLLAYAILLFIRSALSSSTFYRRQSYIVLASSFFPVLGNILYISGHSPFPGMDTTPVGFAITGMFLTWGLFQYKLLDLVPVGRESIIENLKDSVIIIDTRFRILDFNPAAMELFDLDGKPGYGDQLEKDFPAVMRFLQGNAGDTSFMQNEIRYGQKILELTKTEIKDQRGTLAGYSLFITDISIRKNAEKALRESEERSRQVLESAPFPMLICDILTGTIMHHNKWAADNLQLKHNVDSGENLPSLFCDPAEYRRLVSILDKNRLVTDYEAQVLSNQKKKIWVLTTVSIISYGNDEAMLVSFNDITARKMMEEAEKLERQFNEAMIDSASALNSTLNFDEVLDRILTNLENVISHTFANIMLVNDGGTVKIVRAHGYDAKGLENLFQNVNLTVSETPALLKMAMNGTPLVITDTRADPGWMNMPGKSETRSYLGAPIMVKGKVMGYINVESEHPHNYDKHHGRQLLAFADQAAVAIENSRLFEKVEQMAVVDTLTGLYNRRHFYELGEIEIERAKRYNSPLSLLMIDLDHFKNINDTYGHGIGDSVLQEVSEVIGTTLRKIDVPGRLGGEEFVVLLPETNLSNGMIVAERLRKAISKIQVPVENGTPRYVTASLGLAAMDEKNSDLKSIITAADEAMYKAKDQGRNRIQVAVKAS